MFSSFEFNLYQDEPATSKFGVCSKMSNFILRITPVESSTILQADLFDESTI